MQSQSQPGNDQVCPACGSPVPPLAQFCLECGGQVSTADRVPQQEPPGQGTVAPATGDFSKRLPVIAVAAALVLCLSVAGYLGISHYLEGRRITRTSVAEPPTTAPAPQPQTSSQISQAIPTPEISSASPIQELSPTVSSTQGSPPIPSESSSDVTTGAQPNKEAPVRAKEPPRMWQPARPDEPVVHIIPNSPMTPTSQPNSPTPAPTPSSADQQPDRPQQPAVISRTEAPEMHSPAAYVGARSGYVVWNGEIEKNGIITIDGASATPGRIDNGLPGLPVTVDLDTKNYAMVEFPSASNGWKRMRIRTKNKKTAIIVKWDLSQ